MSSTEPVKLLLAGNSKVGKSSIIAQYVRGEFDQDIQPSLTAQFIKKEIITPDQSSITIDLWDIAGGEKFRSLAKIFYKDSKAILLVYDETNEDSFNELKNSWYEQVKNLGCILAVVANKCDLSDKKVKEEDGKKYAESIGAMFFEISAKENIGISNMFEKIAVETKNKN